MQRANARGVRLDFADLPLVHDLAVHPVALRSSVQLGQRGPLGLGPGHDQDPALDHRNAPLATEGAERPTAVNAILGLDAPRLQVVARMDDARITSALMARRTRFLLQER